MLKTDNELEDNFITERMAAGDRLSEFIDSIVRNCLEIISHIPCLFLRERCSKISYIARYAPDF